MDDKANSKMLTEESQWVAYVQFFQYFLLEKFHNEVLRKILSI